MRHAGDDRVLAPGELQDYGVLVLIMDSRFRGNNGKKHWGYGDMDGPPPISSYLLPGGYTSFPSSAADRPRLHVGIMQWGAAPWKPVGVLKPVFSYLGAAKSNLLGSGIPVTHSV